MEDSNRESGRPMQPELTAATSVDSSPTKHLSKSDYDRAFGVSENGTVGAMPHERQKEALQQALDIRKFEISLYWTRAAYFLTFNTLVLGGYGALQTSSVAAPPQLSVVVSCLGLLCSFAWYCANRGSKQWQENWENHVDLLED